MSTMDLIANETIEALRPHATPAEMQRAILLTNDVRKAMVSLKEESSQVTRKNLVHAEQVQAEFVGDLVNRYLSGSSDTPDTADDRFPHKLAAWEYLRDSGWQIGRSQFYEHCKQGRLPRKDGHYLRDDVDRYAKLHCKRVVPPWWPYPVQTVGLIWLPCCATWASAASMSCMWRQASGSMAHCCGLGWWMSCCCI